MGTVVFEEVDGVLPFWWTRSRLRWVMMVYLSKGYEHVWGVWCCFTFMMDTPTCKVGDVYYLFDRHNHVSLELQQPLLDLTTCFGCGDDVTKLHDLALRALHVRDVEDVRELQLRDSLETLLQVRLYPVRGKQLKRVSLCPTVRCAGTVRVLQVFQKQILLFACFFSFFMSCSFPPILLFIFKQHRVLLSFWVEYQHYTLKVGRN